MLGVPGDSMGRESMPTHVPYAAIGRHGLIGDRHTAALVSADGTIDWFCLPDYDGDLICGALLDSKRGGFWRLGPELLTLGRQSYVPDTTTLLTAWDTTCARVELSDTMIWPGPNRPPGCDRQRVI